MAVSLSQVEAYLFHHRPGNYQLSFNLFAKSGNDIESHINNQQNEGIRLNKIFQKTHSRRQADALITSGRVTVNGQSVADAPGVRVTSSDIIELDGEPINSSVLSVKTPKYDYIKYWKPAGVICTTDRRIQNNILDVLESSPMNDERLPRSRIFPVGRLDKDTSGLILLTSDGRVPNSILRGSQKIPKTYTVHVDRDLTSYAISQLERGVVITTQAQRDGKRPPPLTARTRPCKARQLSPRKLSLTIIEGRNRQIRKMIAKVGYTVTKLHRCAFMGMDLNDLPTAGYWKRLSKSEQTQIEEAIKNADKSKQQL